MVDGKQDEVKEGAAKALLPKICRTCGKACGGGMYPVPPASSNEWRRWRDHAPPYQIPDSCLALPGCNCLGPTCPLGEPCRRVVPQVEWIGDGPEDAVATETTGYQDEEQPQPGPYAYAEMYVGVERRAEANTKVWLRTLCTSGRTPHEFIRFDDVVEVRNLARLLNEAADLAEQPTLTAVPT